MVSSCNITQTSAFRARARKGYWAWVFIFVSSSWLSACASGNFTSPRQLEAYPNAVSIPYRISDAGHLIVDVSVNGQSPQPFIIDSGANASAIYDKDSARFGVTENGKTEISFIMAAL